MSRKSRRTDRIEQEEEIPHNEVLKDTSQNAVEKMLIDLKHWAQHNVPLLRKIGLGIGVGIFIFFVGLFVNSQINVRHNKKFTQSLKTFEKTIKDLDTKYSAIRRRNTKAAKLGLKAGFAGELETIENIYHNHKKVVSYFKSKNQKKLNELVTKSKADFLKQAKESENLCNSFWSTASSINGCLIAALSYKAGQQPDKVCRVD